MAFDITSQTISEAADSQSDWTIVNPGASLVPGEIIAKSSRPGARNSADHSKQTETILDDISWTRYHSRLWLEQSMPAPSNVLCGRKRGWDETLDETLHPFFRENGFVPEIPVLEDPNMERISNPFVSDVMDAESLDIVHPAAAAMRTEAGIPEDGKVNGLIKVQFVRKQGRARQRSNLVNRMPLRFQEFSNQEQSTSLLEQEQVSQITTVGYPSTNLALDVVSPLPNWFGRLPHLDRIDSKLFDFYITAICGGRTVITKSNLYLQQFAAMAFNSECVKHVILSLSASYVLDYERSDKLLSRANLHQKHSVKLIGRALNDPETYQPGKEEEVLAALQLLIHNENVNVGVQAVFEPAPPWWKAVLMTETLLAISDPGFRYHHPLNVQSSLARAEIANRTGLLGILARTVAPIELVAAKCDYPWLLHGTETQYRKIVGSTGLSSRLLHHYAKITHLTGKLQQTPDSTAIPAVGKALERLLRNFWQWSDLSDGYTTSDELMSSCAANLNEKGKVGTIREVTELTGESFVAAAQVYLHCRLFKKPRSHYDVQEPLTRLFNCIAWLPNKGSLFTAQAPLCATFIAGLVARTPEQRRIVRVQFETVISACRGNLIKPWRAIQHLWGWFDAGHGDFEAGYTEHSAQGWWEATVHELYYTEGRMDFG